MKNLQGHRVHDKAKAVRVGCFYQYLSFIEPESSYASSYTLLITVPNGPHYYIEGS